MRKELFPELEIQGRRNEKNVPRIAGFCWVIALVLAFALPVQADYQQHYYPDPGLITVERGDQIVDYLQCERIHLDYPGLSDRCDVNMGRDSLGNIWAAVTDAGAGKIDRLFRSQDGGFTWTSIPLSPTQNQELAAFTALKNNNLLLATNVNQAESRLYLSSNRGSTWQLATILEPNPYKYIGEGLLSLTPLNDGRILYPICRYDDDIYETGIYGGVFVSTDGGNTFPTVYPTGDFWGEAHILELQSGKLLMAIRYQRMRNPGETDEEILAWGGNISLTPQMPFTFKNLFLADSDDGGVTWKNFRPLRDNQGQVLIKFGQCHGQLVQVPDGRVVVVYDNRYPNEERDIRARISSDGGQTWAPDVYYLSFGRGYAASVVLEDSTIVTVTGNWPYGHSSPIGPPSAQAIRWKLPPISNTPSITVLAPLPLSQWPAGSQQIILWNTIGSISKVKIHLYKNNSLSTTITSSANNTGSYTWNIPANTTPASDYKIKITDTSNPAVFGESGAFSITRASIAVNKTRSTFGAVVNGVSTGPQGFTITNSGTGTLNWSITDNAAWIDCSPTSGTNNALITVTVVSPGLSAGTYTGTITVFDPLAAGSPQLVQVTLHVYDPNQVSAPWGSFDTPIQGSTVSSSVPFTGWALDDLGVQDVKLYREEGRSLVYIGDAILVEGARPDVELAFPGYPMNDRAGWGYMMLTNFLPGGNGTFTIHAVVADLEGHQQTLGSKTIIVDNAHAVKPFGTIDTPAQGGTASGSGFIDWGWVLTPPPNYIPTNGSTIYVYVDGINLGHPTYNLYRSDIAALFPNYANRNGALGYFYLNTTPYANGVHTISWAAVDNAGNVDGIGSRYFTIQNLAGNNEQGELKDIGLMGEWKNGGMGLTPAVISSLTRNPNMDLLNSFEPLRLQKDYNPESEPETLYPDENGRFTIEIKESDRLVIYLGDHETGNDNDNVGVSPLQKDSLLTPDTEPLTPENPPPGFYHGYLVSGSDLKPLPIGSTLDRWRGIFYWQLGPGFSGDYALVFLIEDREGNITRKNIIITVIPKFFRESRD
jgi:hypothetical protein